MFAQCMRFAGQLLRLYERRTYSCRHKKSRNGCPSRRFLWMPDAASTHGNYLDMDFWNILSRRSVLASQQDCAEFAVVNAWLAVLAALAACWLARSAAARAASAAVFAALASAAACSAVARTSSRVVVLAQPVDRPSTSAAAPTFRTFLIITKNPICFCTKTIFKDTKHCRSCLK